MYRETINRIFLLWLMVCSCGLTIAQPPRGPWIISPQVHDDKTVTFQYLAPLANEVLLSAQFQKAPVPMAKDSLGIWSVTVGPVIPDIYPYSFKVDGVTVMDPANVAFFPNERFKASLIDIPGETPLIHAMREDVPHGIVTYEYYPSIEGSTGSLVVYTPPGYDQEPSKSYPVFYLISGTTDTEEAWFKVGKTNLILDNLISEGKAKPMIIIMPYGNPAARIAEQTGKPKPDDPFGRGNEEALRRGKQFENDLVNHVIPYVDRNYRTISNRENRAIGGFSRGGAQTLRTAFGNLDQFAWICCYSAYLSPDEMDTTYKHLWENPERTNEQLRLFWISVGNEDFLYQGTHEFIDYLMAKKINFKSWINDGGHTWMNTKKYLNATAQLLFQN